MLHTKFRLNWPASSREEDFLKGFYQIWVWWPSWSCDQHHVIRFSFPCVHLKAFIQKLVQICTVVSEKIQFEFLYVHNLGPRSRNNLGLQYSHIFIYPIRCLLLLSFRTLGKIHCFPIEKPKLPNLTLP